MPKKWTHTAAFKYFGTTPRNIQWSWSARNEESSTVVATFWQDEFHRNEGRLVYTWPEQDEDIRGRPGFSEMMENLAWARDHCEGRFRVIIAKAEDVHANPRTILECFPSEVVMRLTKFDPVSGAFVAEAEGPAPVKSARS